MTKGNQLEMDSLMTELTKNLKLRVVKAKTIHFLTSNSLQMHYEFLGCPM